jgi:hypothetical protein
MEQQSPRRGRRTLRSLVDGCRAQTDLRLGNSTPAGVQKPHLMAAPSSSEDEVKGVERGNQRHRCRGGAAASTRCLARLQFTRNYRLSQKA